MIITKNIQKYLVFEEDSVIDTLKKIDANNARIAFVTSETSTLTGVVSDGDIRRWLAGNPVVDLNIPVASMMNKAVRYLPARSDALRISTLFNRGVECVPLVDEKLRLVSLAFEKSLNIDINGREISNQAPTFIIAEIGNNHQGSMAMAKQLVDAAVHAGADCAKFQMRDTEALYVNNGNPNDITQDLGSQYTMDLLKKFQLPNKNLFELFDYCKFRGITPLCTPWDLQSLAALESYGMTAYKISSADLTNHELLAAVANTGKPLLCSTGMSNESEIYEAVSFLSKLSANFVLLHCNSTYPTPYKDVHLNYLKRLAEISHGPVGYSGHERGIEICIAAVALGAAVIEKHLTLDRELEGNDHKASLLPDEFIQLVQGIRNLESAMGSSNAMRELTQGELLNREVLAKSLVTKKDIAQGELITRDKIDIKSPGKGLQPNRINELVGRKANRNITKGDFFYETDIRGKRAKKSCYHFTRPYGIPVRYHDYKSLTSEINVDLLEFHFSYKDLQENPENHFDRPIHASLVVHSPELFENDHILDLASHNKKYVEKSIANVQTVIDTTHHMKKFFHKTSKPIIVLNAGGWSRNGFLDKTTVHQKYQILNHSLEKINLSGVQLAVQTMPPFPWHFGGQSYHNLFVDPAEIEDFCKDNPNIKICLDVSHSMMACNYYGWHLTELIEKLSPYIIHLHISDAKGIDGEGAEIGLGDVDFKKLACDLKNYCPSIGFIPEIWQGHNNKGEGFWRALDFFEAVNM